jgi:malonyl-CoA decarboxylase
VAEAGGTVLDRTIGRLRAGWRGIARGRRRELAESLSPELGDDDAERLRAAIRECLEARGGEVSALARTAELGEAYLKLDATGRARFLAMLASEFGPDRQAIDKAARVILETEGAARAAAERAMRASLMPPRVVLLRQLGALPDGVKFLVDLRAELTRLALDERARAALDDELEELLASWFDVGFLELRRIDWEAPADLLERLIAYEAVHEIRSWNDLKNRLDSDRRCFAFFHPRMPGEPLIFVEVALTSGLADDIHQLLDETAPALDPGAADTAIFYSISNAQRGLAGISLGNFLIKRVVDLLRAEFPALRTFATLSPMPGFRGWLDPAGETLEALVPAADAALVREALDHDLTGYENDVEALRAPLLRIGAHYLLNEKREGRAADPVAHFHLTNGARVERLNFLADRSLKGLRQSAGLMVNYLYKLDEIDANHEAYSGDGVIAASAPMRGLVKG